MVVDIINAMYGSVSDTWAVDYPSDAACFFSPPYPKIATDALGYPPEESINIMSPPPPKGPTAPWDYEPTNSSDDDDPTNSTSSTEGANTISPTQY